MHKFLSKLTAYIILLIGCLVVIGLILSIFALFIYFPDGNITKLTISSVAIAVVALIIGIIAYTLFEMIIEAGEKLSDDNMELPTSSDVEPMVAEKTKEKKDI